MSNPCRGEASVFCITYPEDHSSNPLVYAKIAVPTLHTVAPLNACRNSWQSILLAIPFFLNLSNHISFQCNFENGAYDEFGQTDHLTCG
jgi:hypothetical protein